MDENGGLPILLADDDDDATGGIGIFSREEEDEELAGRFHGSKNGTPFSNCFDNSSNPPPGLKETGALRGNIKFDFGFAPSNPGGGPDDRSPENEECDGNAVE